MGNVDKDLFPTVEEVPDKAKDWQPEGYTPGPDDPGPVTEDHLDDQGASEHGWPIDYERGDPNLVKEEDEEDEEDEGDDD